MWLHIPPDCMSCPFAPASEALTSASDSPSPTPALSVTLSGKLVQRPLSWRGWQTRPWSKLLFGTICAPSTADPGLERWIASLRACPASLTASPASDRATTTSAPSGPSSSASWERCDPPWSSSKTSQLSLLAATSEEQEKHYQTWVTRSKTRSFFVRQMLAHRIGERESSSWPTARANELQGRGAAKRKPGTGGKMLSEEAQQWPTPRGTDGPKGGPNQAGSSGDLMLPSAASQWTTPCQDDTTTRKAKYAQGGTALSMQADQWPTPAARDVKGTNSASHPDRSSGSKHLDQLPNFIEHCFLPSHQALQITPPGSASSQSGQASPRRLNPKFVCWLMGHPEGWSDCTPVDPTSCAFWATASCRLLSLLLLRPSQTA